MENLRQNHLITRHVRKGNYSVQDRYIGKSYACQPELLALTGYVTAVGLVASTYFPNVFLILPHYPSCSFIADTDLKLESY
jgi:hypothetical protein